MNINLKTSSSTSYRMDSAQDKYHAAPEENGAGTSLGRLHQLESEVTLVAANADSVTSTNENDSENGKQQEINEKAQLEPASRPALQMPTQDNRQEGTRCVFLRRIKDFWDGLDQLE